MPRQQVRQAFQKIEAAMGTFKAAITLTYIHLHSTSITKSERSKNVM